MFLKLRSKTAKIKDEWILGVSKRPAQQVMRQP
jgi:hypothetical protein